MNDLQDRKIETERLKLRIPHLNDAPEFSQAMKDVWTNLQAWMSWPQDGLDTVEAAQYYIGTICAEEIQKGGLPLFGFDKATGQFAISTGFNVTNKTKADEYCTGYWVAKEFLGQGYATESTQAILKYAFEHFEAQAILTGYYDGNIASKRVIEKCGFTFTHTEHDSHARCSDGTLLDEHCYKMTKQEWGKNNDKTKL